MSVPVTGPAPREMPGSIEQRLLGPDWVLATRWAADPARMTADELQAAFDHAPLGCTLVLPAQEIGGTRGWVLRRMINLWFATGTGLRGDFPPGAGGNVLTIDVRENSQGTENRDLRIFGNGGRVLVNRTPGHGGDWAVTIGAGHDAGGWAVMGLRIDQLAMTGGRKGALLVDGARPPRGAETSFVTVADCDIAGGITDRASDGTRYLRNRVSSEDRPAFVFDKVPGAYNSRVDGGFAVSRAGALEIVNGDRIGFTDVQCEHPGNAESVQPERAMIVIRGRDRPAAHILIRDCNLGAGDRVARAILLDNAHGTRIEGNHFFLSTRMVADVTLGDRASGSVFRANALRGPRRVQPAGAMTDVSRRMVVQAQTMPLSRPHRGLVTPLDTGLARFAPGWSADPAGLDVLVDGDGVAHFSGAVRGTDAGPIAALPAWLLPHRPARLVAAGDGAGAVLSLTRGADGLAVLAAPQRIPGGLLDLTGISWPTLTEPDYYQGL